MVMPYTTRPMAHHPAYSNTVWLAPEMGEVELELELLAPGALVVLLGSVPFKMIFLEPVRVLLLTATRVRLSRVPAVLLGRIESKKSSSSLSSHPQAEYC